VLGGIELGGTKCICLLGTGPADIKTRVTVPTGADAGTTLSRLEEALRGAIGNHGAIRALGIASFGPLDLARNSPTFGSITATPKPGWSDTPVVPRFARAFGVPVGFDTDVNGAALAEGRWGAAKGLADFAYVTVGTGIGVGLVVNGALAHGFGHPELGHIRVVRAAADNWPGVCVFHGDCLEGLASGPAIAARAGRQAEKLGADDAVWPLAAHALAQLLHTLVLATAPRRIVMGGGVIEGQPELLAQLRRRLGESLNGYLDLDRLVGSMEQYVVPAALGPLAGAFGSLALAADVL
jgi:fructokinase